MKKSYQDEINSNFLEISFGGIAERLLSGPGVTHIDRRVIDDEAYDTSNGEYGAADCYGVSSEPKTGPCACFFIAYDGRLWERENLMQAGLLLLAIQEDFEVKQICAA
ncbi:MAG TPA: hypothetical protein VGQ53_08640 [Chitinophagaceae bacterium]|nr:hypothetical protein [Chitinophagaceae bacterium]